MQLLRSMFDRDEAVCMTVLTGDRRDIEANGLPVSLFPHKKSRHSFLNLLLLRLKNPSEIWLSSGLQANILCLLVCLCTFSLSKLVIRMNNPFEHDLYLIKNKLFRFILKMCFKYVRCVVYQSESMQVSYQKIKFPHSHTIIPNYSHFKFGIKDFGGPDRMRFVNVARFVDQKDHFFLIKLANFLLAEKINFTFDIYGDGPILGKFKDCLAEAKLTSYFQLHGAIPREEIIFAKNVIYVQHSKFEGFPNAIVEALNTGVLVYDFTENFYSRELSQHPNYHKFSKKRYKLTDVTVTRIAQATPMQVGSSSVSKYIEICR